MKALLLLIAFLAPLSLRAEVQTGFVKLADGHEVYAEYLPAAPGRPTVALVSGLVYDLSRWNSFANALSARGFGVVRYNFRGQQNTLRRELAHGAPAFYRDGLTRESLSEELSQLLDALHVTKASVVGLSYGAGIAAEFGQRHPEKIDQLVFFSPLVISLDNYDPSGAWIQWNLSAVKIFWGPLWGQWAYDQYYDFIYRNYLRDLGGDRIPPDMRDLAADYKESLFHQVRAMRDFDLRAYHFPALSGRVHLFNASAESEPALKDQFRAWRNFGADQGSMVYLSPSAHAIPDVTGPWAADLVAALIDGDARLARGQAYYSQPRFGWMGLQKLDVDALEIRALAEPREFGVNPERH